MSWKDIIKESPKGTGTWPAGTEEEQIKRYGYVMFDEFGRDADERGEFKRDEFLKEMKYLLEKYEKYKKKNSPRRFKFIQGMLEECQDELDNKGGE